MDGFVPGRHDCLFNSQGDVDSEQRGKGWGRPYRHRIQGDVALSQPSEAFDVGDDVGAVSKGMRRRQPQTRLKHQARGSQWDIDALTDHPELACFADSTQAPGTAHATSCEARQKLLLRKTRPICPMRRRWN